MILILCLKKNISVFMPFNIRHIRILSIIFCLYDKQFFCLMHKKIILWTTNNDSKELWSNLFCLSISINFTDYH